jgi:hypothetical protein
MQQTASTTHVFASADKIAAWNTQTLALAFVTRSTCYYV